MHFLTVPGGTDLLITGLMDAMGVNVTDGSLVPIIANRVDGDMHILLKRTTGYESPEPNFKALGYLSNKYSSLASSVAGDGTERVSLGTCFLRYARRALSNTHDAMHVDPYPGFQERIRDFARRVADI